MEDESVSREEFGVERSTEPPTADTDDSPTAPTALRVVIERQRAELRRFREAYEQALTSYRSQPSWKMMLLCRQAYRLLVEGGWKERREFFKWLWSVPGAGTSGLC